MFFYLALRLNANLCSILELLLKSYIFSLASLINFSISGAIDSSAAIKSCCCLRLHLETKSLSLLYHSLSFNEVELLILSKKYSEFALLLNSTMSMIM